MIDEFPANVYCKFLLPKVILNFIQKGLYIFLLKIINKIPSKNGYLKRIFNHIFLTKLRVKLSEINFYRKEKINKKILSKLKKKIILIISLTLFTILIINFQNQIRNLR